MIFYIFTKKDKVWSLWGTKPFRLNTRQTDEFLKQYDDVCCIQEDLYELIGQL